MAYNRLRPQTSLAHFGTLLCLFLLSEFPTSIEAGHSDAPTKFGSPELRIYHNASVPVAADPLADPQSLPHRSKEGYASAISDDVLGQIFSSIEAYQGSGAHERMGKAGHRRGIQSSFGETTSSDGLRSLNPPDTDYTRFVNTFIGTSTNTYGDVFPGASVPFGMAKIGINNEGYAPAGYLSDIDMRVRGVSPLHDSGTGSSLGSYGNFEVLPLQCLGGFQTCTTRLADRWRKRKNGTDFATPGYFTTTLNNSLKIEVTSTRRAGLERFTWNTQDRPYLVFDLTNDLPNSFSGGSLRIDTKKGQITMGGAFHPSFGPSKYTYRAYACYDLPQGGKHLDEYGVWGGDPVYGIDQKFKGITEIDLSDSLVGKSGDAPAKGIQAGALISLKNLPKDSQGRPQLLLRVGVSFVSADQACANAQEEVPHFDLDSVVQESKALWNEKLKRMELDLRTANKNITTMWYSSLYRSYLTPNNATGEGVAPFTKDSIFFDSLYCSWDTFRTFYPWLSLSSPKDYAQIVETYIDGYRKLGWIPECRSNQVPGYTQGGSDATNILADFAVKYAEEAKDLGIDLKELYSALLKDGTAEPPEWDVQGRQIRAYAKYGYVPYAHFDPQSSGRQTREGSRTLEYANNDFAIRQVSRLLGKNEDTKIFRNRSMFYRNVFDPSVTSDGFKGFMQKRGDDGKFVYTDPKACSPKDTDPNRSCSLQAQTSTGFYESSSWEYTFFAPFDTAGLIGLLGGPKEFVRRLDHFFDDGYYLSGNEPSFQTPVGYHYANQPALSVRRVRQIVYDNFNEKDDGIPGNDDQAGFYPVPSTTEYLILSPFVPKYAIHNEYLGKSTIVTVANFDPRCVNVRNIPRGVRAYVKTITYNGHPLEGGKRCHLDFLAVFKKGGDIVIEVTNSEADALGCVGSLPSSLSTGGFGAADGH